MRKYTPYTVIGVAALWTTPLFYTRSIRWVIKKRKTQRAREGWRPYPRKYALVCTYIVVYKFINLGDDRRRFWRFSQFSPSPLALANAAAPTRVNNDRP